MLLWETLEEDFDRHGSHTGLEVKETQLVDAEPISDVLGVGKSRRQANKAHLVTCLLSDVAHAANDDFDDGASILPK